ncbi:MAG: hypothetical protein VX899_14845 [Myxococcota bacterium]|nr:hypothetical protein [Myxococcota bacterium]
MNTKAKLIFAAVTLLLVGTPTALFWLQNASRVTGLSLNLGFFATQLAQPVSVPVLMAVTLAVGLLMGLILGALFRRRGPADLPPIPSSASQDPWT